MQLPRLRENDVLANLYEKLQLAALAKAGQAHNN